MGERLAQYALNSLNLRMVEKIHVGWRLLRTVNRRGSQTLAWIVPQKKVSGDYRAITDTGRSVLIEVKYRDEKLLWSNLAKHQVEALNEHVTYGGLSLLIWVTSEEAFVLRWPVEGFAPRKSLTVDKAAPLDCKYTVIGE